MEVYAFFRNCPQGQMLPVVLTAAVRIDVGDLLALRTIRILKTQHDPESAACAGGQRHGIAFGPAS